jgi:hypothetical protein
MCGAILDGGAGNHTPQQHAAPVDESSAEPSAPIGRAPRPRDSIGFGHPAFRGGALSHGSASSVRMKAEERSRRERMLNESWVELAIVFGAGLVVAWAFSSWPFARIMGWFLSALCHELGHSVVAWFFGMPAYPAIRLDGHAAAIHQDQKLILVLLIQAGWIAGCWFGRHNRWLLTGSAVMAVVYPVLAFSVTARELLHLIGGHGGELVFGTVFLWRALDGGFAGSRVERILYAGLGTYLVLDHALLCFGLMTSAAARDHYAHNGSFGLTNDYLRVAHDVCYTSLTNVAFWMFVATLLPVPAAWLLWQVERWLLLRCEDDEGEDERFYSDDELAV